MNKFYMNIAMKGLHVNQMIIML